MPTAKPPELARIQEWFLEKVVAPHEAGPSDRPPVPSPDAADRVILPSRTLAPGERLDVYTRMYFIRLYDCLLEDYPVVHHLIGDAGFEKLARGYLTRFPSRTYTLNHLGADLPRYLDDERVRIPRRALCRDVARIERAMSEVFDAKATPVIARDELPEIAPEAWPAVRLRPIGPFQLISANHRANHIVTAVRQEKPLPALGRKSTWVVCWRKGHTVWRMDLTKPSHAALAALAAGGTVGEALLAAGNVFKGSPESLATQVFRWFDEWISEGFFQAIEL